MLIMFTSCGKVPMGYVGIRRALYGSEKGDIELLQPGLYFVGPTKHFSILPTYLVTKVWTSSLTEDSPISEAITFQSKEGVSLIANVGIEYFIIQED
ncbi:MAG: hypothetical protein ACRCTZ_20520, partial [Sarcina sp.]